MIAEIIAIGDEIITGQVLDSNSAFIAQALNENGIEVKYHVSCGDNQSDILMAFKQAHQRAQIVICTGGLGPTTDDITLECASVFFDDPLQENDQALIWLQDFMHQRGKAISDNNLKQTLLPRQSLPLKNDVGTACGVYFCYEGKHYYFLPGVPKEMKSLLSERVFPHLASHETLGHVQSFYFKTFGIAESEVDRRLSPLQQPAMSIGRLKLSYRAHFPEVIVKVTGLNAGELTKYEKTQLNLIQNELQEFCYSAELHETMASVVISKLKERGWTLATAESCTGGLIGQHITRVSGASDVFKGSVVAYANEVKELVLKVDAETLESVGAVSEAVAKQMVEHVSQLLRTDTAISITGIAGPSGGTNQKPVGTAYIGIKTPHGVFVKHYSYARGRQEFQEHVAWYALDLLRRALD